MPTPEKTKTTKETRAKDAAEFLASMTASRRSAEADADISLGVFANALIKAIDNKDRVAINTAVKRIADYSWLYQSDRY